MALSTTVHTASTAADTVTDNDVCVCWQVAGVMTGQNQSAEPVRSAQPTVAVSPPPQTATHKGLADDDAAYDGR